VYSCQNESANQTWNSYTSLTSRSRFKDITVLMRRSLWSSCISFSFSLLSLALQHQFSSHRITEDKLQRTNNIHHTCISTILLRHSSSKGFCHCPEQCVLHPPWCSTNSVTALKALNDIYPLSSHWTASLPISTEALSPRPNAHMTDITSKQQSWSFEGICVPFCLTNCLFPIPNSQPMATELF